MSIVINSTPSCKRSKIFWPDHMVLPKPEELKDFSAFEDSAVIKLIAASQPEAMEVLYERYGRIVFERVLNAVDQADVAERISLEVFLYVWENALKYPKERTTLSDWLEKIARDHAVQSLAKDQNTIGEIEPADEGGEGQLAASIGAVDTESPSPQAELPPGLKKKLMHEVKRRKAILLER